MKAATLTLARLWPTKLVRRHLPGFEPVNVELSKLIEHEETRQSDLTVRYQEQNFFARPEPPVTWLRRQIDETVLAYLEHVGVREPLKWKVEGWYNVNRLGDHHAPHAHPGAYLSGTYYVCVPVDVSEGLPRRDGAHPACISFHDPRCAANMLAGNTGLDSNPVHVVRPSAGTLMMWPAMLQHYVHPNQSRQERVSISYNIVLENRYRNP